MSVQLAVMCKINQAGNPLNTADSALAWQWVELVQDWWSRWNRLITMTLRYMAHSLALITAESPLL
jgi:hypothetical protein